MKKITDRLALIAGLIGNGKTVADIGTDHGFLPLYLQRKFESPKVILTDISELSLFKAKKNIASEYSKEEIDKFFDFRLGSGLDVIGAAEVVAVCFAGMGGELMARLMSENREKAESFESLVFQPRTGQGELRRFLVSNGFEITDERLVRESKFICEIIRAKYTGNDFKTCCKSSEIMYAEEKKENLANMLDLKGKDLDETLKIYEKYDARFEITPKMMRENPELAEEFLKYKITKERAVMDDLPKKDDRQVSARLEVGIANVIYMNMLATLAST